MFSVAGYMTQPLIWSWGQLEDLSARASDWPMVAHIATFLLSCCSVVCLWYWACAEAASCLDPELVG